MGARLSTRPVKPSQIGSYESWGSVLPDSERIRTASRLSQATFDDVKTKGRRLLAEGQYTIWKESTWSILADVQGDHGTYVVYVNANARVNAYSKNTFSYWNCTCEWSNWAWTRMTLTGRMCSHVYAMYLYLSKKRHSMIDNPQTRQADAFYAQIRDYIGGTEFPATINRAIRNPGGSDWEMILADVRADLGDVSLTTFDQALGAFKGITASRKQAALNETDCLDFAISSLSDGDFLDFVLDDPDNDVVSFDEEAIDNLVDEFIDANYDNLEPGFSRDNAVILIEDYSKELFMNRRASRSASRKLVSRGPDYKLTEDDFLEYVTSYMSDQEILDLDDDDRALSDLVYDYMSDEQLDLSPEFDPALAEDRIRDFAEAIRFDLNLTASRKRAFGEEYYNDVNNLPPIDYSDPKFDVTEEDFADDVQYFVPGWMYISDYELESRYDDFVSENEGELSPSFSKEKAFQLVHERAEAVRNDPSYIGSVRPRSASRKRAAEVPCEYPGGMEGFITDFYGVTGSRVLVTDKIAAAAAAAEYRAAVGLVQASQRDLISEVRASAEIVSRGHYTSHRARRVPSKTAGRHFTAIERQLLIDEEGVARQYKAGLLNM